MGAVCKAVFKKGEHFDIPEEFHYDGVAAASSLEPASSFLEDLQQSYGPAGRQYAIALLKPKLLPVIQKYDLTWADLAPVLEEIDTVEELRDALEHPVQFLMNLGLAFSPVARRLAIAKLRPRLQPILDQDELVWEDVVPVLEQIGSLEELRDAIADPRLFLGKIAKSPGPAGKKLLIAKLRAPLAPHLNQLGITWVDLVPVLDQIDSVDAIRDAAKDPQKFLSNLETGTGAVAKALAIAKLLPKIDNLLEREGITRNDARAVLDQIDSIEELRQGWHHPREFFDDLVKSVQPVAKQLLIARLRPRLAPLLRIRRLEISFKDLQPALEQVESVQELKEALDDPALFLESLQRDSCLVGKKFVIAQLHSRLPPFLEREGLVWEDILPVLEAVESVQDLRRALSNPQALFDTIAVSRGQASRRLAIARLHPRIAAYLGLHGLSWKDFLPVLHQIDSLKMLVDAGNDPQKFVSAMEKSGGVCAKKLAIAKLKPKLTMHLEEKQLKWDDVLPVLANFEPVEELRAALLNPGAFLKELMKNNSKASKHLLLAQLRQKLGPFIERDSLTWSDIAADLSDQNTSEELQVAIREPEQFMKKLVRSQGKRLLIAQLRPVLVPNLKRYGVTWQEFSTVLERVDSAQELKAGLDSPNDFLQKLNASADDLGTSLSDAAVRLAIIKLKPKLAPSLKKKGLTWEEMGPVLAELKAHDIREAGINPEEFLEELGSDFNGQAGRHFVIAQLRSLCSSYLDQHGLKWKDVAWALEEVDTVEELRYGLSQRDFEPASFLTELKKSIGDVRKRLIIAELRPKMVDDLESKGVAFDDIIPALDQMDEEVLLAKLGLPPKGFPKPPDHQPG